MNQLSCSHYLYAVLLGMFDGCCDVGSCDNKGNTNNNTTIVGGALIITIIFSFCQTD